MLILYVRFLVEGTLYSRERKMSYPTAERVWGASTGDPVHLQLQWRHIIILSKREFIKGESRRREKDSTANWPHSPDHLTQRFLICLFFQLLISIQRKSRGSHSTKQAEVAASMRHGSITCPGTFLRSLLKKVTSTEHCKSRETHDLIKCFPLCHTKRSPTTKANAVQWDDIKNRKSFHNNEFARQSPLLESVIASVASIYTASMMANHETSSNRGSQLM